MEQLRKGQARKRISISPISGAATSLLATQTGRREPERSTLHISAAMLVLAPTLAAAGG
jgi:hypothetical protein